MKKSAFISFAILFLAAIPSDAHFFGWHRSHLFHHSAHAPMPVVQNIGQGISQIISNVSNQNVATITVDSAVKTSIANTTSNLREAKGILDKLIEQNKDKLPNSAASSGPTVDNPKQLDLD